VARESHAQTASPVSIAFAGSRREPCSQALPLSAPPPFQHLDRLVMDGRLDRGEASVQRFECFGGAEERRSATHIVNDGNGSDRLEGGAKVQGGAELTQELEAFT
jgi:hypothetical protein